MREDVNISSTSYRIFISTTGSSAMTNRKELMEHRKHKRFKVKHGAIAMIRLLPAQPEQIMDMGMGGDTLAAKPKYCQIINISKGGLVLRYIDRNGELNEPFKLNVSFVQDSISFTYLKYVSCKTDWTSHEASKSSSSRVKTKQRGVQFGEMTPHQTSQLNRFIQKYTIR